MHTWRVTGFLIENFQKRTASEDVEAQLRPSRHQVERAALKVLRPILKSLHTTYQSFHITKVKKVA